MMNPNPEESRRIAKEQMYLMRKLNIPEEMKKPGKNGPSLDSLINREKDITRRIKRE